MKVDELPVGKTRKALEFPHFPTRLQAVVWRNWGLVPLERLAKALKASEAQIEELASGMGLPLDDRLCCLWHRRGYVTIIRRNWHLLPYRQILELLDWPPEHMAYVLKEDDFLWCKLGHLKPETEPVVYSQLSKSEKRDTARMLCMLKKYFPAEQGIPEYPFSFLKHYGKRKPVQGSGTSLKRFGMKLLYSYSAVYGDPLLDEKLDPYPDDLLSDYSASGINAVWLQGTLYTLVPWLGEIKASEDWEIRLENLRKLCRRAEKHGIKIFLYLNEPRSMPQGFFRDHADWIGARSRDGLSGTLCTSRKIVQHALKDGISMLFREVGALGGVFTITMSENLTNCCSRPYDIEKPCPVCSSRGPAVIVAELNNIIAEGVHRENPEADVIAWTWGWAPEWDERAVELLPKDVKVMCVSETALPTCAMGVKGSVLDYSISKIGPGPVASRLWKKAADRGLGTVAKIQMNNTWECAAVPYIPVPGLVERHLSNLQSVGVKDIMISWTLGGFPGGNIELLRTPKENIAERFGPRAAKSILKAWKCFDKAFEEFPLNSTGQLYTAPQNYGPMNLLFSRPTGYKATMVGFPYDDIDTWRGNHYPEDVLEEQFRKISVGWNRGLRQLALARNAIVPDSTVAFVELANVAEAFYCHFRSSYLQIRFVRIRNKGGAKEISEILDEEIDLAVRLHRVMLRDSRIGYEAGSQYLYTAGDLKEKVLNCEFLRREVIKKQR